MMEKHLCAWGPADVLGALGVEVEGGDRAKAEPMEPKKGEKSRWRGGRCSLAVTVLTGSSQRGQVQGRWAWRGARLAHTFSQLIHSLLGGFIPWGIHNL